MTFTKLFLTSLLVLVLASGCAAPAQTSTSTVPPASALPSPTALATLAPLPTTALQATPTAEIPVSGQATAQATPTGAAQTATGCQAPASQTPPMTEGPYFKAGSPETSDLYQPGMAGMKLTLSGTVFYSDCTPAANAVVDFWQANAQGQYDNSGYTLRGHQVTDASGHYQLVTVVPGLYPGRTEHIHVKVQPAGGKVLTTQLFFPGVAQNQQDQIYDPGLLIRVESNSANEMTATYNFVVAKP